MDGYTVSEVDIRLIDETSGKSTSVKIRKNNADNEPGDLVATLTNPGTLTADSLNTFTAPDVITLDASTTYWLTVNEGISSDRAQFSIRQRKRRNRRDGLEHRRQPPVERLTKTAIWFDRNLFPVDDNQRHGPLRRHLVRHTPLSGTSEATVTGAAGTVSSGNECTDYLSDDDFTHAMTDYSIGAAVRPVRRTVAPVAASPVITTDSKSLVLHVGSDTFAFEDADVQAVGPAGEWNEFRSQLDHRRRDSTEANRRRQRHGRPDDFRCAPGGHDADGGHLRHRRRRRPAGDILPTSGSGSPPTARRRISAQNSTHTVSSLDVATTIRVDVRFTDLAGNSEGPLPSEATAAVVPAAGPCPAGNDWCATMTVGILEDSGTSYGFLAGNYGQLDEPTIDYGPSFEVEEITIFEPDGPDNDLIYVIPDADVPLGTVFNLGGTEFTADDGSRIGSGIYFWSRPANFAWIVGQEVRVSANLAPAPGERHRGRHVPGPHPFRGPRHGLGPGGKRIYREGGRRRRNEPVNRVGRHQDGDTHPGERRSSTSQVP